MPNDENGILKVKIDSQNERMQYLASCKDNEAINVDYSAPMGDGDGYTSLELLLIALSSCVASTVGFLLRSHGAKIEKIKAEATGCRRDEHPTGFKSISIAMTFFSDGLKRENVDTALQAASGIAPVWCMLKEAAQIDIEYTIESCS